jgi:hypothetical protein
VTTAADILDGARRALSDYDAARNWVLSHTVSDGEGTVSFRYPLNVIREGTRFSSGLRTFYVVSVIDSSNTAIVQQIEGPAGLMATGDIVYASPAHSNWELFQAANDDLSDLSSPYNRLYQMKSLELAWNAQLIGYDLSGATDMLSIYSVEYATPGPYKAWLRASRDLYRLNLSASTGDFTSGKSLDLFSGVATGFTVRITYKASYGQLTDLTTTLASIGVPDTLRDVLYNGTALRVMTGGEVARNAISAQGDPRRAAEVPAGAVANSLQGLARVRAGRIAAEQARLAALYPDYMTY